MNHIRRFTLACSAIALLSGSAALGQSDPAIEDAIVQQGQIADILRGQQQSAGQETDETEIDGEAGVYVLRVNGIFFIGANGGIGYSENPARIANNSGGSGFASAGVSAGVQTRINGAVDVGLRADLLGVEYFESNAPSSRSVAGSLAVGTNLGKSPLYASANFFGGFNFDRSFDDGVSFYGAGLSLGAGLLLGKRTLLRPGIGVTRQWSGISENNSTSATASLSLTHLATGSLTIGADLQVSRVWFDDFYEDVTAVPRNDWQYSAGLDANYAFTRWLSLNASAGYEKRDSSFFLSAYDGFETSLVLSARRRF